MSKFKVGDTVRVRKDLEIGGVYYMENGKYGDSFTSTMRNNSAGKEATIIAVRDGGRGYRLNIDNFNTYYDQMLEVPVDLKDKPYVFNVEIEKLISKLEKEGHKKLIDKALDEKLHETDPETFKKIVNNYRQYA